MPDLRERILVRLTEVCAGLPGIQSCLRNSPLADATLFPAVMILDADEAADEPATPRHGAPQRVRMTPEIYLILEDEAEEVGPTLNSLRAALLKAVLADGVLLGLTGTNGSIRYEGCATGLARGRSMVGEMGVSITFTYPLKLNDL